MTDKRPSLEGTWILSHVIDEDSPLFGLTHKQMSEDMRYFTSPSNPSNPKNLFNLLNIPTTYDGCCGCVDNL